MRGLVQPLPHHPRSQRHWSWSLLTSWSLPLCGPLLPGPSPESWHSPAAPSLSTPNAPGGAAAGASLDSHSLFCLHPHICIVNK